MKGARGVLINITGGMDMTLFEVDEAANRIRDEVDPDANIIFGSTFDDSLQGRIRVSVVATGIDLGAMQQPKPARPVLVSDRPVAPRMVPAAGDALKTARPVAASPATAAAAAMAAAAPAAATTATAGALAMAAPAPSAETRKLDQPFLAPRPLEPSPRPAQLAAPAPAPAPVPAAPESVAAAEPRRVRRGMAQIFTRVAGAPRRPAVEPQFEPAAPVQPVEPQFEPAAPVQPRLGGLDPSDRPAASRAEDDLLEIPAFLRRQAN
jgi:cell division protein FtsZ